MIRGRRQARERGRIVARILAGAWRASPPPPDCPPELLRPLIPILIRQGSGGLAWKRIRDSALADLPQATALQDVYRRTVLQERLREQQLLEALDFFRERGLAPVLAKGWALSRLYGEPGLRPYGDLDLWFSPRQLQEAHEAMRDPHRPVVPIELHAGFNELADRSPEDLLRRVRTTSLKGTEVRIFGPEDHLRLVALHALEHGLARPLWLCDVAVLLENLPVDFDWSLAREGDPWLRRGFGCALGLARELLGVEPAAAEGLGDRRGASLPSWLVPAALSALGARSHYMDVPDPSSLLLQPGPLLQAARLRWANPVEVTFRRRASWDRGPRLPHQAVDFLARSWGVMLRTPRHFRRRRTPPA